MNKKPLKILADENMPQVCEIFSEFGEVVLRSGREISAQDLVDVDVLLVRSITQVNQALIAGSAVKFVGTATIGTDHVDQPMLQKKGVGFSNAPGCNADAVVEYVLSAIFLLAEQQGFDPAERTYGIVGVGNVGGRLQRRLQALGFNVLLNDPPRALNEAGFVELDELVEKADFICLHTPLTRYEPFPTHHLFNSSLLQKLKANTVLLNAGRGPVIDNEALLDLGQKRADLTFVLDVWEFEPVVNPELAARCALVSPHIAGYSLDGKIRGTYMLYQALAEYLKYPVTKRLEDFLPVAELSEIKQDELSVLDIMRLVYDPRRDDRDLREIVTFPLEEQKLAFDQLRKNYPVRREFASLAVRASSDSEIVSALGFQIE